MADYKLGTHLTGETETKFGRKLNNREQLDLIIRLSDGNKDIFEDLLFTAKYLMGLLRAVTKPEYTPNEVLNGEITGSIQKIQDILKLLLKDDYDIMKAKYFAGDKTALNELAVFLSEIELLKFHINDLKREG